MRRTADPALPGPPLMPIDPSSIQINGARPIVRTFHHDARGFLLETMRADDTTIDGSHFEMSYSSVTLPGQFRDADRWHLHKIQTDRFVVVLGEMTLALFDGRPDSSTRGRLEVIRMVGASQASLSRSPPKDVTGHLVPVPPGVLHCIGNLGTEPFLLVNFPTEMYDPADEGRVPFAEKTIPSLGRPFAWSLVEKSRHPM